jgi:hypothetical protein
VKIQHIGQEWCIYMIKLFLSASCGRLIDTGIGIYKFACPSLLPSPLQIVTDGYIRHPHIEPHMLLIRVPFA